MAVRLFMFVALFFVSQNLLAQHHGCYRRGVDSVRDCFSYVDSLGFGHSAAQKREICRGGANLSCFRYVQNLGFMHTVEQAAIICEYTEPTCVKSVHQSQGGIVEDAGDACRY